MDLAAGCVPEVEGGLEAATLHYETFVCLLDARACGVDPSLDDCAALPHILVSLRGEPFGHLDGLLLGRHAALLRPVAIPTAA